MPRIQNSAEPEDFGGVGDFELAPLKPKQTTRDVARLQPCARFLLMHDPAAWQVKFGKVLPRLSKLKLIAGVNGVLYLRGGGADHGDAVKRAEADGRVVFKEDIDGKPYIAGYNVRGGVAYVERWVKPIKGSHRTKVDSKDEKQFLESLVSDGHIQPAELHVIEAMRVVLNAEAVKLEKKVASNPGLGGRLKELKARLSVVEAWLENNAEDAEPIDVEPVKKTTKKGASDE